MLEVIHNCTAEVMRYELAYHLQLDMRRFDYLEVCEQS